MSRQGFFRDMILLDEPVEVDETYKNAGRKGRKRRKPRRRGRKGRGRGTYSTDRPPIFTIRGRESGIIVFRAHRKATKNTSRIVVRRHVKPGNMVYTDSYDIYGWLGRSRQYGHGSVNHSAGEYARGDVHINGAEFGNQRFKEFLLGRRGVSKSCLDGYCGAATLWVRCCVWSPRDAFWAIIDSVFIQKKST